MDDASDVHGWVSDAAKVLDIEERRALNAVCEELRDSNVEAAVVILEALAPEVSSPSGFCAALLNFWGVGHPRLHTGLLVLLLVQQRRLEMRTGYGLVRQLPTQTLQRIQREKMMPLFAEKKFGKALCEGLAAVQTELSLATPADATQPNRHGFGGGQTPIDEFLERTKS
eukprot:symbB.v1.2.026181.t1/scaffold2595.1/size75214/2